MSSPQLVGPIKAQHLKAPLLYREKCPFGTPIFTPEIPPKMLMRVPLFCVLSQEMRHINFFSGGPEWGVLGGDQKVYVEKFMCFFSVP